MATSWFQLSDDVIAVSGSFREQAGHRHRDRLAQPRELARPAALHAEDVAGTLAPRLLLEYFIRNVPRMAIYELVDNPSCENTVWE